MLLLHIHISDDRLAVLYSLRVLLFADGHCHLSRQNNGALFRNKYGNFRVDWDLELGSTEIFKMVWYFIKYHSIAIAVFS